MRKIPFLFIVVLLFSVGVFIGLNLSAEDHKPVSVPMTTNLAGKTGVVAAKSVFRILVPSKNKSGSAFLHKSGNVITAAHIVEGNDPNEVFLINRRGQKKAVKGILIDSDFDIALLIPSNVLTGHSLPISTKTKFSVGSQVTTWGFPSGYKGLIPLLSVGYLSGEDAIKTDSGKSINRWVVNAAFNLGNSGGPLVSVEDGTVIGIVNSKLTPIPPRVESEIEALKKQKTGFQFTATLPDGTKKKINQARVIADVLQYLRSQTQLVIGHTVQVKDLREFLKTHNIEP